MRRYLVPLTATCLIAAGIWFMRYTYQLRRNAPLIPQPEFQAEWKEIQPEGKGFRISFPGDPKQREDFVDQDGKIRVDTLDLERSEFPALFFLSYFEQRSPVDVATFLDTIARTIPAERKGTLLSTKEIALDRHPGRELKFIQPGRRVGDHSGDHLTTMRIYEVNHRWYHVAVVTPKEQASAPYIDRFLNSFTLIEK